MRFGPHVAGWHAALGDRDDGPAKAAMLGLALGFHGWRALVADGGLASPAAAALMAAAVVDAADP